jgi:mRNA turnover protein 4
MPKSKRAKVISLTATKQVRKDIKSRLVTSIRTAAASFTSCFVFSFRNLRTEALKNVRAEWADSRFFLGKNKVMQLALSGEGVGAGYDALAECVRGNVGLLFTNRARGAVEAFFGGFSASDFARAGFVPAATIQQPPGRLMELPHTMLEQLRKLGMPVALDKGVIVLPQAYTLCRAGQQLTPEQGRLLKHFGHQLAEFRIRLVACVEKGRFEELEGAGEEMDDEGAGGEGGGAAAADEGEEEEEEGEASEVAAPPKIKGKAKGGR